MTIAKGRPSTRGLMSRAAAVPRKTSKAEIDAAFADEDKKALVDAAPAATKVSHDDTTNQEATMAKTKKADTGREPNLESYRWIGVTAIQEHPKYTREALIALCRKAHGGTEAQWAKRLGRARRFAKRKGITLPAAVESKSEPVKAKAKGSKPKAKKAKKDDLGDLG